MTSTKFALLLILLCTYAISSSQEFMHWKFLENKKTDRIKTENVWQYPVTDSSENNVKTLFSYKEIDVYGRTIALRLYSNDTSFFTYDSLGVKKNRTYENGTHQEYKKIIKYSKTGKIIYEYQPKIEYKKPQAEMPSHEYFYFYDSLDREVKMVVSPSKEKFFSHDTIVNLIFYTKANKDSIRAHYIGGELRKRTSFYYDKNNNCIKKISCRYGPSNYCDTTTLIFNDLGQKIGMNQQWHRANDTKTYVDIRTWEYDKKGRMTMASDNVSICRWKYNKRGYVIEAKRFNKKDNKLKFFVKYEYTFWKKREIRKRKIRNLNKI